MRKGLKYYGILIQAMAPPWTLIESAILAMPTVMPFATNIAATKVIVMAPQ